MAEGAIEFRLQNKQLLGSVIINNPHSKRLAFKVMLTEPRKYKVQPSSGIVKPGSSVSAQVIMMPQNEGAPCMDKFLVQTALLEDIDEIAMDPFTKDKRGKEVKEVRLRGILAPPSPRPEANKGGVGDDGRKSSSRNSTGGNNGRAALASSNGGDAEEDKEGGDVAAAAIVAPAAAAAGGTAAVPTAETRFAPLVPEFVANRTDSAISLVGAAEESEQKGRAPHKPRMARAPRAPREPREPRWPRDSRTPRTPRTPRKPRVRSTSCATTQPCRAASSAATQYGRPAQQPLHACGAGLPLTSAVTHQHSSSPKVARSKGAGKKQAGSQSRRCTRSAPLLPQLPPQLQPQVQPQMHGTAPQKGDVHAGLADGDATEAAAAAAVAGKVLSEARARLAVTRPKTKGKAFEKRREEAQRLDMLQLKAELKAQRKAMIKAKAVNGRPETAKMAQVVCDTREDQFVREVQQEVGAALTEVAVLLMAEAAQGAGASAIQPAVAEAVHSAAAAAASPKATVLPFAGSSASLTTGEDCLSLACAALPSTTEAVLLKRGDVVLLQNLTPGVPLNTFASCGDSPGKGNGMIMEEKIMFVAESTAFCKLYINVYVNKLHMGISDEELCKMCEEFGIVTGGAVMTDNTSGSKGFSFVNFDNAEAAGKCADALRAKGMDVINGMRISVKTVTGCERMVCGVLEETSVKGFKILINQQYGLCCEDQHVLIGGRQRSDSARLIDCGGGPIHLVPRLWAAMDTGAAPSTEALRALLADRVDADSMQRFTNARLQLMKDNCFDTVGLLEAASKEDLAAILPLGLAAILKCKFPSAGYIATVSAEQLMLSALPRFAAVVGRPLRKNSHSHGENSHDYDKISHWDIAQDVRSLQQELADLQRRFPPPTQVAPAAPNREEDVVSALLYATNTYVNEVAGELRWTSRYESGGHGVGKSFIDMVARTAQDEVFCCLEAKGTWQWTAALWRQCCERGAMHPAMRQLFGDLILEGAAVGVLSNYEESVAVRRHYSDSSSRELWVSDVFCCDGSSDLPFCLTMLWVLKEAYAQREACRLFGPPQPPGSGKGGERPGRPSSGGGSGPDFGKGSGQQGSGGGSGGVPPGNGGGQQGQGAQGDGLGGGSGPPGGKQSGGGQNAGGTTTLASATSIILGRKIATGSSGVVVEGIVGGAPAAVKVFNGAVAAVEQLCEVQAYRSMARLQGRYVPRLLSSGNLPESNHPYLATSLEGQDLSGAVSSQLRAAAWEALCQVHQCGLVHGDLRKENMLLGRSMGCGAVVLIDFARSKPLTPALARSEMEQYYSLFSTEG